MASGENLCTGAVPSYVDKVTGMEVESIFNRERIAPTPEMLSRVDTVVFDIREAGTRFLNTCIAVPLS